MAENPTETLASTSTTPSNNPDASVVSVQALQGNVNLEETFRKRGFELNDLLGEGAYAKVYKASYTDPKPPNKKQMLACKIVDVSKAPKEFVRKFFPREMALICKLNHHNLVRVHSILKLQSKHFIFMSLCDRGDILQFMKRYGAVREKKARDWFGQILDGLAYLHSKNIVHRDLKCENILITTDLNVKIADFGFARFWSDAEDKSHTFCGSVMYAPPELIKGKPYNPKLGDLWSLGVVLYIMLNKSMPFDDTSLRRMYEAQMNRTWRIRTRVRDILSQEVKDFIYILLEPAPELRRSIDELHADQWFSITLPDIPIGFVRNLPTPVDAGATGPAIATTTVPATTTTTAPTTTTTTAPATTTTTAPATATTAAPAPATAVPEAEPIIERNVNVNTNVVAAEESVPQEQVQPRPNPEPDTILGHLIEPEKPKNKKTASRASKVAKSK